MHYFKYLFLFTLVIIYYNLCSAPITISFYKKLSLTFRLFISHTGIKEPSLTCSSFMKFAVPSLQHSNGGVREGGSKIIIKCYKLCGDEVKSYLPKADNKLKKNPLYRLVLKKLSSNKATYKLFFYIYLIFFN